MIHTWYNRIVLGIGGLTALAIGSAITLAPHAFYASYGIAIAAEPTLLSELRAPGANLAVLGMIMLGGAIKASLFPAARLLAVSVFLAFALGRMLSWIVDGQPSLNIVAALIIELVIGALAALTYLGSNAQVQTSQSSHLPES